MDDCNENMRPLLPIFCLLLFLLTSSCQNEEQIISSEITGKWQLVQIIQHSMVSGKSDVVEEPSYLEIYEFQPDGSFVRYRSNNNEITGTYTISQDAGQKVVLASSESKELGCHDLNVEVICIDKDGSVFFRQTDSNVLVESYVASDGPSFIYQRITSEE